MSATSAPARWELARIRDPQVSSLEVWNLPLPDRRLFWEVAGTPFVESQRLRGVADVLIAREIAGAVADAAKQLHKHEGFDRLWITGGLTALAGFAGAAGHAFASVAFDPQVAPAGAFAGEAGGRALLAARGHAGGVVVDVGQTSIKVSVFPGDASASAARPARILRARHLDQLPRQFIGVAPVTAASARTAVSAAAPWIAESILDALDAVVPRPVPPAIVLGLPCPVDDALVPGACTYGWAGDATLVPRIAEALVAAGAFAEAATDVDLLVLNDAELAAASLPPELPPVAKTLVLTIGFGPGAALRRA